MKVKVIDLPPADLVAGTDVLLLEQNSGTKNTTVTKLISDLGLVTNTTLAANSAAQRIGTKSGNNVQVELDKIKLNATQTQDEIAQVQTSVAEIESKQEAFGNTVQEELNNNLLNDREQWRRSLVETGLTLVDGSFEEGASVQNDKQAVWYIAGGQCYVWGGLLPKTVYANSTPASTGGIGQGAWVDVTDASLRQGLAAPGGADMVGNTKGDSSIFSYRTVAKALKDSLWFDDFKGTTDDERWASMAAYLSTPVVTSISVMFSARMHSFTSNPQQLTKPFELHGMGVRNTILTFTDCNGVSADLSSYGSRYIQSKISNMALVANSSNANTGVYFKGVQSYSPHDAAIVLSNVSLYGFRDISSGGAEANEWGTAISLDDADEIHMHDVYITGSNLNALYATRTTSKSIVANKVTGLRVSQSSIYLTGTGIEVTGQSEGMILRGLTIVAVDIGVSFHDMVNPANNHVISDSHISAFTKGIEFRKHANRINNPTAVYLSNLFILEREGNASKPLYTAIELYAIRSILSGITIQSNTNTSPNRKAIVVSNQNNAISDIIGLNVGAGITIDAVDTLNVMYNNIRFVGDLQSDLSGSVQYAVGAGLTNSGDPNSYNVRGDTFRTYDLQGREQYSSNGGRHMFGGGRHNVNVYHDFRCSGGGAPSYDGRISFTGGSSTVDGQAQGTIYASTLAIAGQLVPSKANTFTCGTSGRPWAGGFTQTAFTVTSDETHKTKPVMLARGAHDHSVTKDAEMMASPHADTILDAWSEVDFVQFKYLDRVEAKGEEGARWHFGVIAQRAIEAFERHGLDAFAFGFACYDEWGETEEIIDEETGEIITERVEAGSKYGIRYEEALVLEAALQRRNCKEQKLINEELFRRIEALEAK